jgi:hypothetical protein
MGLRLAIALLVVGCGRYGFDPLYGDDDNGGGDGGSNGSNGDGSPALVEPPTVIDAWTFGSAQRDYMVAITSIGTDVVGVGYMGGPIDFGTGVVNPSMQDGFVARFDANGTARYAFGLGGNSTFDSTQDVVADAAGNIYVTGRYTNSIDIGAVRLMSNGQNDCFLISFDTNGAYRWSHSIGGTMNDACWGMDIDSAGNVYVFGDYSGTATFGDGSFTSAGMSDVFIASYASDGTHRRTARFGGTGRAMAYGIAVSDAMTCIAGSFEGTASYGGGTLSATGDYQGVVGCYDSSTFAHRFSKVIGGAITPGAFGEATSIAIDETGVVHVTGYIGALNNEVRSFDFGIATLMNQQGDGFITAYDATGTPVYVTKVGGPGIDQPWQIRAAAGAIYLVGDMEDAFDLGGGLLGTAGTTTKWGLLASYNYGGALRWAFDLHDASMWDVEVIADQLWVGGGFTGTVTFPTGTFTSAGIVDTLLLSYQGR